MKATSPSRIVLSLALLTVLTGCAFAPEPTVDRSAPAQWTQQPTDRTDRAGEPTPGAKLTVADLQTWWSRWNDAELNALVDQAVSSGVVGVTSTAVGERIAETQTSWPGRTGSVAFALNLRTWPPTEMRISP